MFESIAYVNGEYVPLQQARISVLDRGFLFADAVYEVIPVYTGYCYQLDAHIQRLQHSLAGIRLRVAHTAADWTELIHSVVERNGGGDMSVYLQVTRGSMPKRDHTMPQQPVPNVVAFCQARAATDPALLQHGIDAVIMDDTRWRYCSIKSTALLPNILMSDHAHTNGAAEALLVRDGCVLEGTSSNVFAVIDGRIITPALRDEILPGITRGVILDLARQHDLPHAETAALTVEQLRGADEIWITSSTREIYPVTRLDDAPVGAGRPGPVWERTSTLLQATTSV